MSKLIYIAGCDTGLSQSIEVLLRVSGLSVKVFESGRSLLFSAIKARPSCIVVESTLPDIDSLTILDRLRQYGLEIPVIIICAKSSDSAGEDISMAVKALKAGAWDYFEKPFIHQRLIGSVNRALNKVPSH